MNNPVCNNESDSNDVVSPPVNTRIRDFSSVRDYTTDELERELKRRKTVRTVSVKVITTHVYTTYEDIEVREGEDPVEKMEDEIYNEGRIIELGECECDESFVVELDK